MILILAIRLIKIKRSKDYYENTLLMGSFLRACNLGFGVDFDRECECEVKRVARLGINTDVGSTQKWRGFQRGQK